LLIAPAAFANELGPKGANQHGFSASIGVPVAGGTAKLQGNYGFGKIKEGSRDYSMYSIATAYEYPISKRTLFYSFAVYGQGKKAASSIGELNSWTISAGLSHSF